MGSLGLAGSFRRQTWLAERLTRSESTALRRHFGFLESRGNSRVIVTVSLRAEMRLPGAAVLDFRIEHISQGKSKLYQTALFQPRGLFGLVYWWAVFPLHHFVFRKMLEGIDHDALDIARTDT